MFWESTLETSTFRVGIKFNHFNIWEKTSQRFFHYKNIYELFCILYDSVTNINHEHSLLVTQTPLELCK